MGTIIQQNKMTNIKFQHHILHEVSGECSRSFAWNRDDNYKPSHVTYYIYKNYDAVAIYKMT